MKYKEHPTHVKGDIGELIVQLDLIRKGFLVFKPITQNSFADLCFLNSKTNKIETIQTKFLTPDKGCLHVPLLRRVCTTTKKAEITYCYKDVQLDWIAAVDGNTNNVYYLPREIWVEKHAWLQLRVDLPKKGADLKKIIMADRYIEI